MTIRAGVLAAWVAASVVLTTGVAQAKPLPVTVKADRSDTCWVSGLTGTGSCGGFATADADGTSIAEVFLTSEGNGARPSTGYSQALDLFYGHFTVPKPVKSLTVTAMTRVNSASAAWTAGPLAQPGEAGTAEVFLQNFLYESPVGCCLWGSGAADVTVVSANSSGPGETVGGGTYAVSYTIVPREGFERLPAGEYKTLARNYARAYFQQGSGTLRAALDGVVTITAASSG